MNKKLFLFIVLIVFIFIIFIRYTISPDKDYIMICNNKIVQINFKRHIKKILYNPDIITSDEKPQFSLGVKYCKIDNNIYLSAGKTYKYTVGEKVLKKANFKGDLINCIPSKKILYFIKNNNSLYKYKINKNMIKPVGYMRELNSSFAWDNNIRGVTIVDDRYIIFNDNKQVIIYDEYLDKIVEKWYAPNCRIPTIKLYNNKFICINKDNQKGVLYSLQNKKSIIKINIEPNGLFYDKELNGIYYKSTSDISVMTLTLFYSLNKKRIYFLSKSCHF